MGDGEWDGGWGWGWGCQVCQMVEPLIYEFYSLLTSESVRAQSYPMTVTSGDVFHSTIRLKSLTSCVALTARAQSKKSIDC